MPPPAPTAMHLPDEGPAVPPHLELLYPRPQIEARLDALADAVAAWAREAERDTGRQLLAVCLLRGGVFFFADLLLRVRHSLEPGFCRAWSYAKDSNERPEVSCRLEWQDLAVVDRDVVFLDNICDSGRTLAVAAAQAAERGAARIRTAVLVHRLRPDSTHTPTLAGFVYAGPEWLVGYGLRDGQARANLPAVYRVRR